MKVVAQKLGAFLRHYWYIPLVAIIGFIFYLVTKDKKVIDWDRVLAESRDAHKKEVEAIEKANREQIEATNRAIKRMEQAENQVRFEYERNSRELDAKKEKRIKKIIKQLSDDPHALANELERETGYRVLIID